MVTKTEMEEAKTEMEEEMIMMIGVAGDLLEIMIDPRTVGMTEMIDMIKMIDHPVEEAIQEIDMKNKTMRIIQNFSSEDLTEVRPKNKQEKYSVNLERFLMLLFLKDLDLLNLLMQALLKMQNLNYINKMYSVTGQSMYSQQGIREEMEAVEEAEVDTVAVEAGVTAEETEEVVSEEEIWVMSNAIIATRWAT